jgi:hypothetical protein
MALIDDPGTAMAAFFAGRDAYLKSLNQIEGAPGDLTIDELGEDALDAIMAAVEAATPALRAQGIQMALTAVERLLGTRTAATAVGQMVSALEAPGGEQAGMQPVWTTSGIQAVLDQIRAEVAPGGASA